MSNRTLVSVYYGSLISETFKAITAKSEFGKIGLIKTAHY